MTTSQMLGEYRDVESGSYDGGPGDSLAVVAERDAWAAALERHLPAGGSVLDVGAGSLSLAAARLGFAVTALALSLCTLDRLRAVADAQGLHIDVRYGRAEDPPPGPFDAVMQRHLLWTLPDPGAALAAWRAVAPSGKLILFDALYFGRDPLDARRGRGVARRPFDTTRVRNCDVAEAAVPAPARGMDSDAIVRLVEESGWGPARVGLLRDVEWTRSLALPPTERLFRVTADFAVTAG